VPPRRLLSRDYFEQRLEEECHRGDRTQTIFSVLRIDASAPGPADAIEQVIARELRGVPPKDSKSPTTSPRLMPRAETLAGH